MSFKWILYTPQAHLKCYYSRGHKFWWHATFFLVISQYYISVFILLDKWLWGVKYPYHGSKTKVNEVARWCKKDDNDGFFFFEKKKKRRMSNHNEFYSILCIKAYNAPQYFILSTTWKQINKYTHNNWCICTNTHD